MPQWIKNILAPQIQPIVDQAVVAALAKSDRPNVTELPTQMTWGAPFAGASRKKYMGTIDFDSLRTFSVLYDVARACINHRKRQIGNLEWAIVPKDEETDADDLRRPIEEITAFFEEPCHQHDFKTWTDKIIEDLLVLDASVLWKDGTFGRKLKELLPVDAATIRLRIAEDGTLPEPPEVAYQQVIYGEVKNEYTIDELYYKMMNPRTNTPYGLSPLECLVIGVDSALRSQMYNASLLSEGTVPEGFFGLPPEWTPAQIKEYQIWFDSLMAGNNAASTRIKFMPGGKGVGYMPTKKPEDMRYLEFEKWLLLKTCAMFDVQPQDIGFIENITMSTQEGQHQAGNQRGLVPMAVYLKRLFTEIIRKDFGRTDLKFEWKGLQVIDNEFELKLTQAMINAGAKTINEWRLEQGMEPREEEAADVPLVFTASGPVTLEDIGAEEEEAEAEPIVDKVPEEDMEIEEMEKWEKKCVNYIKQGKGMPEFVASHIDKAAQTLIRSRLTVAKSKEEVRAAFMPFKESAMEKSLTRRAIKVSGDISKFKRTKYERIGSRA